ncbi:unnamed protein product [Trichobilharzia szidati]|nr:unnamed protein product [Trichobilharzia szidati]
MVLFEELKNEIPSRKAQFCRGDVYIDRFYDIKAAGPVSHCDKYTMKHCLQHLKGRATPELTKRIDRWTNPGVEERRLFHALVNDPEMETAKLMKHGVVSKDRTQIKDVIRPPEPTVLGEMLTKVREEIYESVKKRPLGQTPAPNLPSHIDKYKTTFGIKYDAGERIGDLVNPPRKRVDIINEELDNREHYLISHKHLLPGEQAHRRYENFDENQVFGIHTYCDPRGIHVRRAMNWITNETNKIHTPIMNQIQFDFKEKYDHVLGKVRDPIRDTMNVPDDHTFGIQYKDHNLTAGQLLHGLLPRKIAGLPVEEDTSEKTDDSNTKKCIYSGERFKCMLPVIHHALRNERYWHGPEITAVLCQLANKSNLIPMIDARRIYNHFQVPLDEELTEQLFDLVTVPAPTEMMNEVKERLKKDKENGVNTEKNYHTENDMISWAVDWRKLGELLDCKRLNDWSDGKSRQECGCAYTESVKPEANEDIEAVRRRLRRAIQANVHNWTTSSSTYGGNQYGLINTDNWATLGGKYFQSDKPVPKVRKSADLTNYCDEAGVGSLISPSVFTEYGLSSRDLLMLRNKEEIMNLFSRANLCSLFDAPLSFDKVWEMAVTLDKELLGSKASPSTAGDHQVTLQSFKDALYTLRKKVIQEKVDREYAQKCC